MFIRLPAGTAARVLRRLGRLCAGVWRQMICCRPRHYEIDRYSGTQYADRSRMSDRLQELSHFAMRAW